MKKKTFDYASINLGRHCYIYPNGGCAEVVVAILQDYFAQVDFEFIDDACEHTSLESQKDRILKSQDLVLVCAGEIQSTLEQRLHSLGITYVDGRELAAFYLGEAISHQTTTLAGGGHLLS